MKYVIRGMTLFCFDLDEFTNADNIALSSTEVVYEKEDNYFFNNQLSIVSQVCFSSPISIGVTKWWWNSWSLGEKWIQTNNTIEIHITWQIYTLFAVTISMKYSCVSTFK